MEVRLIALVRMMASLSVQSPLAHSGSRMPCKNAVYDV